MTWMHLTNLLLCKSVRIKSYILFYVYLFKIQNQAKLIYSVRTQNSGCLWGEYEVMGHKWGFGELVGSVS